MTHPKMNHPLRASRAPCKGAPLADRQSRIRGGRLVVPIHASWVPVGAMDN